jgi:hypothetical protein
MNDTMSLFLATTILALGGLGLYIYKSSDDNKKEEDEEYNEDSIFDSTNFWGLENKGDEINNTNIEEYREDEEEYKPKRKNVKTQKNKKLSLNSRRRY